MEYGRGETGGGGHSRSLCILRERPSRSNRRGAKGGHVIGVCGVPALGAQEAVHGRFLAMNSTVGAPSSSSLSTYRFSADRASCQLKRLSRQSPAIQRSTFNCT